MSKTTPAEAPKSPLWKRIPYRWMHVAAIVAIYAFCTIVYGDVFERAQQNCFVASSSELMTYVKNLPLGDVYCAARYLMLPFKNLWIGGAWLTMWLVGSACLLARALRLSRRWKLLTFLLPIATLGYMAWRGTRIYYHDEPSTVILIPMVVMLVAACCALVGQFLRKKAECVSVAHPASVGVVAVAFAALFACTSVFRDNDIVSAKLQNMMLEGDWQGMEVAALSAKQANRTVAAYYAISLVQQDKLLDKIFDLPFDYPEDTKYLLADGKTEYSFFESDCNFYAGLINSSYRSAMEQHVMSGPTIYNYKRLAKCAVMNGETQLAERYLFALSQVPFEQEFVERWRMLLLNPQLIDADPELSRVRALKPREETTEQNYRRPIFMGYNVGLGQGSDATLTTSIAATLYSKDMMRMLNMASVLRHKNQGRLPRIVREAIMIKSITMPELKQAFPEITGDAMLLTNFQSFVSQARPYLDDKPLLREKLRKDWLGTYFYYYYCENNNPSQVQSKTSSAGVN
ncbi:MAG: hypothetical protein II200_05320 [Bacteroidaceae bacterium]|nr:hypothetical protein [Bacteroidaceae bacterium]